MNITRDVFKKIILLSVVVTFGGIASEYLPFLSDYGVLREQLHQGYISKVIGHGIVEISIMVILLLTYLISLILLYFFKPIGRPIYLVTFLLTIVYLMTAGDIIQYSILYPLDILGSFLEIFILYLIYFTKLKMEFDK